MDGRMIRGTRRISAANIGFFGIVMPQIGNYRQLFGLVPRYKS